VATRLLFGPAEVEAGSGVAGREAGGGSVSMPPRTRGAVAEGEAMAEPDVAGAARGEAEPQPAFGSALAASMALLEEPPIMPESRARLTAALKKPRGSLADTVQTIETDIGLALAVTAQANRLPGRPRNGIASIPEAVQTLGSRPILKLLESLPELGPPSAGDRMSAALARITPHSIATRSAADLVAARVGTSDRDALRLAAVLHDVGKIALAAASATYLERAIDPSATPADRAARERRALGVDHAGLGAIALGRMGVPRKVAGAVERHHADDADNAAAVIRLADMLAHEARGDAVDPRLFTAAGEAVGLKAADLRALAYELAREGGPRTVGGEPSPLTPMQQKVLLGLRRGLTYKQIAVDLQVSESTVRSHLHKTYERLGVVDRAQAVLLAQDRGWI
jgi:putative nucleotidyltransferase with HDIG domain